MASIVDQITLSYDMGFRCAMDSNKPGIAHLISAFTGKKITADDIISLTVQKDVQPMPPSHRVIYDAYAVTKDMDYILEIQLKEEKDLANRIRFYIGASDTSELMWGKPYSGLKRKTVIFYCAFDFAKEGKPLYTYRVRRDDGDDSVDFGIRIIMVNGTYRGPGPVVKVNNDMFQRRNGFFYFPILEESLEAITTGSRRIEMCGIVEQYGIYKAEQKAAELQERFEKERAEMNEQFENERESLARQMLADNMPIEKIMSYTKLSREAVLALIA